MGYEHVGLLGEPQRPQPREVFTPPPTPSTPLTQVGHVEDRGSEGSVGSREQHHFSPHSTHGVAGPPEAPHGSPPPHATPPPAPASRASTPVTPSGTAALDATCVAILGKQLTVIRRCARALRWVELTLGRIMGCLRAIEAQQVVTNTQQLQFNTGMMEVLGNMLVEMQDSNSRFSGFPGFLLSTCQLSGYLSSVCLLSGTPPAYLGSCVSILEKYPKILTSDEIDSFPECHYMINNNTFMGAAKAKATLPRLLSEIPSLLGIINWISSLQRRQSLMGSLFRLQRRQSLMGSSSGRFGQVCTSSADIINWIPSLQRRQSLMGSSSGRFGQVCTSSAGIINWISKLQRRQSLMESLSRLQRRQSLMESLSRLQRRQSLMGSSGRFLANLHLFCRHYKLDIQSSEEVVFDGKFFWSLWASLHIFCRHYKLDIQSTEEAVFDGKFFWSFWVYRIQSNILYSTNPKYKLPIVYLPSDGLSLSTVKKCNPLSEFRCQWCMRINILLNTTGYPKIRGFDVRVLEESYNTFQSFRIVRRRNTKPLKFWDIQYDCLNVTPGQNVIVSLLTVPDYGLRINKTYFVPDMDAKPDFQFLHLPETREIQVSLSKGPTAITRLCYQCLLCESLSSEVKQEFTVSKNATLKYEHFIPCLCIEVYYTGQDSRRNKICPFATHPDAYGPDFWKISWSYDNSQMRMQFKSECQLQPSVSLCMKHEHNGSCFIVPEASIHSVDLTAEFPDSTLNTITDYTLDNVDKDPHLCFKFAVQNRTHVKCPEIRDRDWNVKMQTQLYGVLLTVVSRVPATFSAILVYLNKSTGDYEPQKHIYNVTKSKNGQKEVYLYVPKPSSGGCIQVWRSDIRFAYKHLICPDMSHGHLGLVFLTSLLVVFTLVLLLFLGCQRIWEIFQAPLWRRTVLLVYSPDSAEYKTLICAFADFLQSILGCEVILDLWDMNTVSQIGILPWFYKKRELVSERKGNVMIVWTKKSKTMYEQWKNSDLGGLKWTDPTNLFGVAMSCLQKDFEAEEQKEKMRDYSVVYFEGLCEKQDIPANLKKISKYRLFKDLYRLISKLQDTIYMSPPCLIKGVAKYLMRKMASSEKSIRLQHHVELCRQRLYEQFNEQIAT
ncbi:interleukin-17 receptor E [Rhinophrynus dorsalis]